MPKEMPVSLIEEIIAGFALNAKHLFEAGFDGVEIVGSHGYLPAQFLSAHVNRRDDKYGGDFERRLTFIKKVISAIRLSAPALTIGLRLSADEMDSLGIDSDEMANICAALDDDVDYFSLVAGTSAGLGSSVHIVAPMGVPAGYIASLCSGIRSKINSPLIVTGRINQPQDAEKIIKEGQADLCGMTRAMICDSHMPVKAQHGRVDDIRACIGCNQACIGRAHKGLPISCIQHPESGRELQFPAIKKSLEKKRIAVIGGGPAGVKAALTAAQHGHRVTLFEKASQLGGQVLLAQRLPGREEFGGVVTNLVHELTTTGVVIKKNCAVTLKSVRELNPDNVILATGARNYIPDSLSLDGTQVVHC